MLEKPGLKDDKIVSCVMREYGLNVEDMAFLPLGADLNTAVYRVVSDDKTVYFAKLRGGEFDEASVAVPKYLSDLGIKQIIPPLTNQAGELWTDLGLFKMILYPYVKGLNGFEKKLSDQQWIEFGAALKSFHTTDIPPVITNGIKNEDFSPQWREIVRSFLERIENDIYHESVALEMAAFLKTKKAETLELVSRAEWLAQILQMHPSEFILCHGDVHAWNLLIDDNGAWYMVDWDTLIFAPKERDLMFVGGGLGGNATAPQDEENLFYQGYGQTRVDPIAMAYYRYERIIEDIAIFCEQILLTDEGGKNREQSLAYLKSNFLPGGTIDIARQADNVSRNDQTTLHNLPTCS